MANDKPIRYCAVYTRKSSEEGLEQDFNSLDAQREAGEAYIKSQEHEGWRLVKPHYDDGGISGGTLDRPGLQELLTDIRAGKVHIVVVYKVDRLSRSLSDFAKLVDVFEKHGVSFVSVTQQFNTTTSMGRLMLNVLLSFAQFEREVTGERIRDKIAASRKKGIWMGGHPPIGYDCHDRKLHINEAEAKTVRHIYSRYIELHGVRELQAELERDGYRTKERTSTTGHEFGGVPFSRGHLYKLLSNRIYIGEAVHKGTAYPGEHEAIIDQKLWDDVQSILTNNRHAHRTDQNVESPALLKGLLYDDADNHMSPTRSGKNAKRYRYYVSQAILQHQDAKAGSLPRLPAHDLERLVTNAVLKALSDEPKTRQAAAGFAELNESERSEFLRGIIQRVEVSKCKAALTINLDKFLAEILDSSGDGTTLSIKPIHVDIPIEIIEKRGAVRIITKDEPEPIMDGDNSALIKAIARGYYWREQLISGEVKSVEDIGRQAGVSNRYVSHILRYGFCAPSIVEHALEGLPATLIVRDLNALSWLNS